MHHVIFLSIQEQFLIYQHVTFAYELFKLVGILTTLLISSFYLFKQQSPLKQLNQMYQHL